MIEIKASGHVIANNLMLLTCRFPNSSSRASLPPLDRDDLASELGKCFKSAKSGTLCQPAYTSTSQRWMKSQDKNKPKINGILRP